MKETRTRIKTKLNAAVDEFVPQVKTSGREEKYGWIVEAQEAKKQLEATIAAEAKKNPKAFCS